MTKLSKQVGPATQLTSTASSRASVQSKPGRPSPPEKAQTVMKARTVQKSSSVSDSSQLPVQSKSSILGPPPKFVRRVGKPLPLSHSFLRIHKPQIPAAKENSSSKHPKTSKTKNLPKKKIKRFETRVFENKKETKKSQNEAVVGDLISFEEVLHENPVLLTQFESTHPMDNDLLTDTFGDPITQAIDANDVDLINLN